MSQAFAASPSEFVPSVAEAALDGLLKPQKTLPARLFYDDEGCRLFQRITELPEYYLTRTEHALLGRQPAGAGGVFAAPLRPGHAGGIRHER